MYLSYVEDIYILFETKEYILYYFLINVWFKEKLNNWLSPTKKRSFFTFQELYTNIVVILNNYMTSVKCHFEIQKDGIMWNYWINMNSMVSRAISTFLEGQNWEAKAISIFSFKMEVDSLWSFIVRGITSIT